MKPYCLQNGDHELVDTVLDVQSSTNIGIARQFERGNVLVSAGHRYRCGLALLHLRVCIITKSYSGK